jgi:hypothetical protein
MQIWNAITDRGFCPLADAIVTKPLICYYVKPGSFYKNSSILSEK